MKLVKARMEKFLGAVRVTGLSWAEWFEFCLELGLCLGTLDMCGTVHLAYLDICSWRS